MLTDTQKAEITARWDTFRNGITYPVVIDPKDVAKFALTFYQDFGQEGLTYFSQRVHLAQLDDGDRRLLVGIGAGHVTGDALGRISDGAADVTDHVKRLWSAGFCEVTVCFGETWALTRFGEEAIAGGPA